jgi:acetylornithine deacetylase/succinyl-diaminopimelate desuccinylase-like protein
MHCLFLLGLILRFAGDGPGPKAARDLPEALEDPGVSEALVHVDRHRDQTAEQLRDLGAIISPSGHEHERAEAVEGRMRAIGLTDVRVDTSPNAVGVIPGTSGSSLVFIATLDDLKTVAEHQRTVGPPRIEEERVVGPGTNTSSTTAALLAAAEAIIASGLKPTHDLVFAAVAQEETGLVGVKNLYEELGDRALAYVDVLGDGRRISYGALVIHWWKVIGHGPPGHTLRGGLPNVNRGLARAVDRILGLPQPELHEDRRTAINISVLQSGAVFNHKPATGWFSLDVRSLDAPIVEEIEKDVGDILEEVGRETETRLVMEPFHLTPGGQIPGARESDLVRTSAAIARHLGFEEPTLSDRGSSNMNLPIGRGTPAIGLGGQRGGRRGFPDEWADIPAMIDTAKHVVLLAATMGGARTMP